MANSTVTTIRATSRASCKIRDNYYTVEYCEERMLKDGLTDEDIAEERAILWDVVNNECDNQVADIIKTFNSAQK